jgi:hypothetical protein
MPDPQMPLFGRSHPFSIEHRDAQNHHRYVLARVWNPKLGSVAFVMLNPSTADKDVDDATSRRCIGYARRWGYGSVVLVNLYSRRATKPQELLDRYRAYRNGPAADHWLRQETENATEVIAAWGGFHRYIDGGERVREVAELLDGIELKALALTQQGDPRHPLYLPKKAVRAPYDLAATINTGGAHPNN